MSKSNVGHNKVQKQGLVMSSVLQRPCFISCMITEKETGCRWLVCVRCSPNLELSGLNRFGKVRGEPCTKTLQTTRTVILPHNHHTALSALCVVLAHWTSPLLYMPLPYWFHHFRALLLAFIAVTHVLSIPTRFVTKSVLRMCEPVC